MEQNISRLYKILLSVSSGQKRFASTGGRWWQITVSLYNCMSSCNFDTSPYFSKHLNCEIVLFFYVNAAFSTSLLLL